MSKPVSSIELGFSPFKSEKSTKPPVTHSCASELV